RQKSVAAVLALSWVGHVGFVAAFYCGANALWSEELGPIPTLTQHFLLVPIGLVIQAVIPTPGGAGAGAWGFGALCVLFRGAGAPFPRGRSAGSIGGNGACSARRPGGGGGRHALRLLRPIVRGPPRHLLPLVALAGGGPGAPPVRRHRRPAARRARGRPRRAP